MGSVVAAAERELGCCRLDRKVINFAVAARERPANARIISIQRLEGWQDSVNGDRDIRGPQIEWARNGIMLARDVDREHLIFSAILVFLGYGEDQNYPVVLEMIYDGRLNDVFRIWSLRKVDLNESNEQQGVIVAFAQQDMTQLFMEGISPQYFIFFMKVFDGVLDSRINSLLQKWIPDDNQRLVETAIQIKESKVTREVIIEGYKVMKQQEVINPLMEAIRALPREEMMDMAEAFVELTSMRRKVDSALQTVGGPVDVAFNSKGDGFIWKHRKLYFDAKLNGDYFERRNRRLRKAD